MLLLPASAGAAAHHSVRASATSPLRVAAESPQPITGTAIIRSVIASFRDRATADIFDGSDSRIARKACPKNLWAIATRKLDQLHRVGRLQDLAIPPGNRLEALRGRRIGQFSIRINDQYRICFRWENDHAYDVEITDYH